IPLSVMPALDVQAGGSVELTFNFVDIDQWEWPRYDVFTGRIGNYPGFVELELASTHGDLNGDGVVDLWDLTQLLANYGATGGATYEDGDLDGDGDVDLSDLAALLAVYGTTCD
ncbi:MAG: hypothetical protein ACE5I3_07260, partial [Phycisphaerae bacterium]